LTLIRINKKNKGLDGITGFSLRLKNNMAKKTKIDTEKDAANSGTIAQTKKVVWLTGSASGVGLALTREFLARGYLVVASDINLLELRKQFSAELKNKNILLYKLDITKQSDWQIVLKATIRKFKKLDILLNIAGYVKPGFLLNIDAKDIDRHININFKGVLNGSLTAAQEMTKSKKGGHIINIASLAGLTPLPGMGLYSASKFAVRSISIVLAHELREKNIFVTVLCPDLIKTPMFDLQLNYEKESALVFSGRKPLTTQDIVNVMFRKILPKKPMEVTLPMYRGILCKIGNLFPRLNYAISHGLKKKGSDKIRSLREGD